MVEHFGYAPVSIPAGMAILFNELWKLGLST